MIRLISAIATSDNRLDTRGASSSAARPHASAMRSRLKIWVGLVFLCIVSIFTGKASAQNSGTVKGRITDSSGAVVAKATIVLRSEDQGRVVTVTSSSTGEYTFNGVPASTYTVVVTAPTFADYTLEKVAVDAGANVQIDAVLHPASESATVTIDVSGGGIDTVSPTIQTVIDPHLIENLPLDGNNVIAAVALLPGVTNVNAPTTFTGDQSGPTYNAPGARSNQNLLLLDGTLWNNLYNNTGLNFPPRQGISEVTVKLNGYTAEFGRNVGSVFNVITKSGSNSFHGQAWEFVQNKFLNAYDYLSKANPKLVQNQFGVSITGPIIRNKLFFEATYQDLRSIAGVVATSNPLTSEEYGYNNDGTVRPCTNPHFAIFTQCAYYGDLSIPTTPQKPGTAANLENPLKYLYPSAGQTALDTAYHLSGGTATTSPCTTALAAEPNALGTFNTATNTNTGYYEIPNICFNPVSLNILKLLPKAQNVTTPGSLPAVVTQASQPRYDSDFLIRMDYILGQHTIAARYYETWVSDQTANGVSSGTGVAGYEINLNTAAIHFGNIDDTWVINSHLLNVLRLAYKRYDYGIAPSDKTTLADLGSDFTQPSSRPALPYVSIGGRLNAGTTRSYLTNVNEDVEAVDTLSYTKGKHNLRGGIDLLWLQFLSIADQAPNLSFTGAFSGLATPDFMMGLMNTGTFGTQASQAAKQHVIYTFLQDDWRVSPRVTLNYGLRYELPFQWYNPNGQGVTYIPGFQSTVFPGAPPGLAYYGDPGIEKSLVGTSYNNLAPRLGFAVDVFGNGRTSVRGSYGFFYDAINALIVGIASPYYYQVNTNQNQGGLSQPLQGYTPIPANYVKGTPAPPFTLPYSITFPDHNFRTPYTESYNLGFQQRIANSTLEVNYVGRAGHHLAMGVDLNPSIYDCSGSYYQINPALYCLPAGSTSIAAFQSTTSYLARSKVQNFNYGGSGVLDYESIGYSNYNALQAIFIMRNSKRLTTTMSYTFGKSLDISSNGTSITNTSETPFFHYAPSDFDVRHVFNLGFTLTLPQLRTGNFVTRALLNGWVVNGIYTAHTGQPFSVYNNGDSSLRREKPQLASFEYGGYNALPSNRHRTQKVMEWFNTLDLCNASPISNSAAVIAMTPTAACPATPDGYGTSPRNYFSGPAYISTNLSVGRKFTLPHDAGKYLDFRVDAFNTFNTPNLAQPQNTVSSQASGASNYGHILTTVGGNGAVGTNGRRLQLSGTLHF